MIVYGMTENEMTKEVLSDMKNAFRYEDVNQNKFRRLVLKAARFPIYYHYVYLSPKKNKWFILLEARSKKEHSEMARLTFVTTHDTPHGIYAIMVSFYKGKPFLILYPPHFFKRFRERMSIDETGEDLMLRHFRYNNSYVFDRSIKIEDSHFSEIAGSSTYGVAFGFQTEENNIMFKTFVSYDMLKGKQIEVYMRNEKIRKEIHDD